MYKRQLFNNFIGGPAISSQLNLHLREELSRLGIRQLVMLTGDHEDAAREVAQQVGITAVSYTHLDVYKRQPVPVYTKELGLAFDLYL